VIHEGGYKVPGASFKEGLGLVFLELGILVKPTDPVIPGHSLGHLLGVIHKGYNDSAGRAFNRAGTFTVHGIQHGLVCCQSGPSLVAQPVFRGIVRGC
jgi:hypothetical protein